MLRQITEKVEIPEGISCSFQGKILKCKKDSVELKRKIDVVGIDIKTEGNSIIFDCKSGNQKHLKTIKSFVVHIKNMFSGLAKQHIYHLEICNVHFPMNVKVEGNKLIISNFLGERTPRHSEILPDVKVEVKGKIITVSSNNKESAGQTAANMEKATQVGKRDKRIFQDGIYITEKPEKAIGGRK